MRRGLFASAWLGSQAFMNAAAFNANIGAWNTASVSNMYQVWLFVACTKRCACCVGARAHAARGSLRERVARLAGIL